MRFRAPIVTTISIAALCGACAPAWATDSPAPGGSPGQLPASPSVASLQSVLSKCNDTAKPSSSFGRSAARRASRTRVLHGRASDTGCGVAMVTVSIARVRGKHCQLVTARGRLGRPGSCNSRHFFVAAGTSSWHIKLPKGLPHGSYLIRTRAIDFAGNIQTPHAQHLRLG